MQCINPHIQILVAAIAPACVRMQVGRMVLSDRCGTRMPAVRATMDAKIGKAYKGLDLTIECFPADDVPDDPNAFQQASSTQTAAAPPILAPARDGALAARRPLAARRAAQAGAM
jgi:hypothetical protein